MNTLPRDMICAIALLLDPDSLSSFRRTCQWINKMIRKSPLLKKLRRKQFQAFYEQDDLGYNQYAKLYCNDDGVEYKTCEDNVGTKRWYRREHDGNYMWKLHRECDLPAVEYAYGTRIWYRRGLFHRAGGPAIIGHGILIDEFPDIKGYFHGRIWCDNGKIHRVGLPAVEYDDGEREWWFNGVVFDGSD